MLNLTCEKSLAFDMTLGFGHANSSEQKAEASYSSQCLKRSLTFAPKERQELNATLTVEPLTR